MNIGSTMLCGLATAIARLRPCSLRHTNRCGLIVRWAGDAQSLKALSRNCLLHLSSSPDELVTQIEGRSPQPAPSKPGDDVLMEELGKFRRLLAADAIEPFLIFGSLLGPIRDGRFIPGDGDLDLGILGKADFETALMRLRQSSEFTIRRIRKFDREPVKIEIQCANGLKLDVKRFVNEATGGTSWYTNNIRASLKKTYPHGFKITKLKFMGQQVAIPADPETFLEWQYGDWKTPDTNYNMITHGPLHGIEHREFIAASSPFAIVRAILYNRRPQSFHAQVRSLAKLFPEDELWPALDAALLEAFERLSIEPAC